MAMGIKEADASYNYDVFLSYGGDDTYCTFTGNLYHALRNKRIKTFFLPHQIQNDDEELELSPHILKAIQESRISIVVLSKNYTSSTRCLDELVSILDCIQKKNQLVLPIFYKLYPSEINHLSSSRNIRKLEERFRDYPHRILQWKQALSIVSFITGWVYGNEIEYEFIEKIVKSTVQSLPRYDVFLSFCGEDTRYSFTGFLYHALRREGFKIFMDDEALKGGNQISQTLQNAIEKSRLSIVVLSENYGYSTWCLDELAKIIECKEAKNQLVWPIFYKIEQSDLSNQKSSYGKAMAAHEDRFGKECENVQKWRLALSEVAKLKGDHHIKENEYEYDTIKKIVEKAIEAENLTSYKIPCTNDNLKEDLSSS